MFTFLYITQCYLTGKWKDWIEHVPACNFCVMLHSMIFMKLNIENYMSCKCTEISTSHKIILFENTAFFYSNVIFIITFKVMVNTSSHVIVETNYNLSLISNK